MFARSLLAATLSFALTAHAQEWAFEATTEQNGNDNSAQIDQQGGPYVSANVVQTGDINKVAIQQVGYNLIVEATQLGNANTLNTNQEGFGLWVHSYQEGERNVQNIAQRTMDWAEATINQIGTDNTATVNQLDTDYNNATLNQLGHANALTLEQAVFLNSLQANQDGTGNQATVGQYGNASGQVDQYGQFNTVVSSQSTYGRLSGSISQTGESNRADVIQTDPSYYGGSTASLMQNGSSNIADLTLYTTNGSFDFTQTGNGNELMVYQYGSSAVGYEENIRGGRITGQSSGDYNRVDIIQGGDNNSLDLLQNGADNIISVSQTSYESDGDSGVINQVGNANYASLDQQVINSGGTASIEQTGMGNRSVIFQR
ncbi:hypothetical protein [Pseudomonas matsuisoli]|uniref:Curlin associated repeat-containing protein n=1 Tax=Pseudomonas matsuisoli TaxID=1515666 RepID=A0A917V135_9PSED|nr:hypothetical protein [Pseudomonas matsuisoli]GGK06516.1 hypothetical protein GCM10009304_35810 [Pseudomonas matsuisoli]